MGVNLFLGWGGGGRLRLGVCRGISKGMGTGKPANARAQTPIGRRVAFRRRAICVEKGGTTSLPDCEAPPPNWEDKG